MYHLVLFVSFSAVAAQESFCPILNRGNVLTASLRGGGCSYNANVPTDACHSTIPNNQNLEFTQQFLAFEEFGRQSFPYVEALASGDIEEEWYDSSNPGLTPPNDRCDSVRLDSNPSSENYQNYKAIRTFTKDEVYNFEREVSIDTPVHPWQKTIEKLCPAVEFGNPETPGSPPSFADARCYGEPYSHQRWNEFYPRRFIKTIQTGAQTNTGIRNELQRHQYKNGEFSKSKNGLFSNTVGPYPGIPEGEFLGSTEGIPMKLQLSLNTQDRQSVFTFDGTFPAKLMIIRMGEPFLLRHYNGLPLSYDCNRGFGSHFITTHEHNGHNPGESDGNPVAFSMPGQYYDYLWPFIIDQVNTFNSDAQDPRASTPCTPRSRVGYLGSDPSKWDDPGQMVMSYPSDCSIINNKIHCPTQKNSVANLPSVEDQERLKCKGFDCCPDGNPDITEKSRCCSDDDSWCFINQGESDHGKSWHRLLMTCPDEGRINSPGDWAEIESTHWFHDHMLDSTAQNVYKGNAAMINYMSAIDRGNECWNDGINLRLPSGCGMKYNVDENVIGGIENDMSWGIRDYDLNVVLASKAWGQDKQGYYGGNLCNETTSGSEYCNDQLFMARYNLDGMLGDKMTVNWIYKPRQLVRPRRYRFRVLNGDVSRFMKLALVLEFPCEGSTENIWDLKLHDNFFHGKKGTNVCYRRVPFHMIANDGNIMNYAVPFDGTMNNYPYSSSKSDWTANNKPDFEANDGDCNRFLGIAPLFSIGERLDLIVDFAQFPVGSILYWVNVLEHDDGRRPEGPMTIAGAVDMLRNILDGSYCDGEDECDTAVGKFWKLEVGEPVPNSVDLSMNPKDYEPPCTLSDVNRCQCPLTTPEIVAKRPGLKMWTRTEHNLNDVARERTATWKHGGAIMVSEEQNNKNTFAIGTKNQGPVPSQIGKTSTLANAVNNVGFNEEEYYKENFLTPENGCNDCTKTTWSIKLDNTGGRRLKNDTKLSHNNLHFEYEITRDLRKERQQAKLTVENKIKSQLRGLKDEEVIDGVVIIPENKKYLADMKVLSIAPEEGSLELINYKGAGGWSHNVHTHFEEGHIISRNGAPPPVWEETARKDIYRVGPHEESTHELTYSIFFNDFPGTYVSHCHNTQHEDKSMLLRYDIENKGQMKPFLTPIQTWRTCGYQETMEMKGASLRTFDREDKKKKTRDNDEERQNVSVEKSTTSSSMSTIHIIFLGVLSVAVLSSSIFLWRYCTSQNVDSKGMVQEEEMSVAM